MRLRRDTKFKDKLICGLENHMRNRQIFTRVLKSLNTGTVMGSFNPKQKKYELKTYRGGIVMTMKNDAKFEEELTCGLKINEEFDEF